MALDLNEGVTGGGRMQGKLNELDKVELHFVRGRVRLGTSFWVCRCYNITSRMFLLTMVSSTAAMTTLSMAVSVAVVICM